VDSTVDATLARSLSPGFSEAKLVCKRSFKENTALSGVIKDSLVAGSLHKLFWEQPIRGVLRRQFEPARITGYLDFGRITPCGTFPVSKLYVQVPVSLASGQFYAPQLRPHIPVKSDSVPHGEPQYPETTRLTALS